ncbi:hypothetical protein BT69DRAFT_1283896 [Atractiella rhizophila]|nr:hypothetical protein BT69DRAFT_1283896 [Atractiella rhizophila]
MDGSWGEEAEKENGRGDDREQDWKERTKTGFIYSCAIVCFPTALGFCHWLAHRGITDFKDICAFATYGALHFASPFLAGFWLWGFAPQGIAKTFGYCLGAQNLAGLITHLLFPTAAPWFFDVYGPPGIHPPANYEDFPGNPAGLIRVDDILGTSLYRKAFKKSPVVFGAIPSLHAATAVCFALFVGRYCRWRGRLVMTIYTLWMFWSTMYLHHHFAIDLLFGTFYSLTAFMVAYLRVLRDIDQRHYDEALTTAWERLWYGRRDGDRLVPSRSSASMSPSSSSEDEKSYGAVPMIPTPQIVIQGGGDWNNVEVQVKDG